MNDAPHPVGEPRGLRLLKTLVIVLMLTMIAGLVTLVVLIVIRFPVVEAPPPLPATITLPDGTTAAAFTRGPDWYAVVTDGGEILIFDLESGALRQRITVR